MEPSCCTFHSIYWESRTSACFEHYLLILRTHARNIPSAVCATPPEDEQVMFETCIGSWLSVNWIKSASSWFHYTHVRSLTRKFSLVILYHINSVYTTGNNFLTALNILNSLTSARFSYGTKKKKKKSLFLSETSVQRTASDSIMDFYSNVVKTIIKYPYSLCSSVHNFITLVNIFETLNTFWFQPIISRHAPRFRHNQDMAEQR
jgi:hypothetical protein